MRPSTTRTPLIERAFAGHHDVLAALRSLRRSPAFVAITVLSLGLAIGLETTAYSMLDAIRHPYNPYGQVDRLYTVAPYAVGPFVPELQREMFRAMRDRHDLFADFVPWFNETTVIEAGTHVVEGTAVTVGARLFDVLGVKPVLGRTFQVAGDGQADAGGAVISYRLWQEEFGENRNLGALSLSFDNHTYRVIGVMGPSVSYPNDADVWLPMPAAAKYDANGPSWIQALTMLHDGDTRARVKAQLDALSARFAEQYRSAHALFDYRVSTLRPTPRAAGDVPSTAALVAGLILLIACLNLGGLLLARGLSRRREMAVRLALGASRLAIMRYVLAECAIIVGLGGCWGMLAAMWGVQLAQSRMPSRILDLGFVNPRLSWRVLAFGFVITAVTVMVAGLLPAIRASRANVHDAMKDGGGGSTAAQRGRMYPWFVMCEVAVALILAVGGTAALRLLYRQARLRLPFGSDDRLTTWVAASNRVCNPRDTASRFADDMVARADAVPGVTAATMQITALTPRSLVTSDQDPQPVETVMAESGHIGYDLVSPDYFRVVNVPIVAGRDFVRGDELTPGVAIVNQRTARRLWPLQSPVGRLIKLGPARSNAPWIPVIGVSGTVYQSATDSTVIAEGPNLAVVRRIGCRYGSMIIRAHGADPLTPVRIFHALRAAMPGAVVAEVRSSRADYAENLRWQRMATALLVAFGVFALALSSVGVYAMLSFVVGQRMREFAMRRALGADAPEVRRLIAKQALELVVGGTALGGVAAVVLGVLVGAFVFGVNDIDPIALALADATILAASLAACVGPVRQAMRADPVELLRSA